MISAHYRAAQRTWSQHGSWQHYPHQICPHFNQTLVNLFLSSLLILLADDVHPNPGQTEIEDSTLSSSISNLVGSGLSIMCLNIQSLKPKLDILEVEAQPYDILVFTETWLRPDISNDDISITNYQAPVRYDRPDRIGGGVAIYVKEGLTFSFRSDLSVNGVEGVWIELSVNKRNFLIGGLYRPPNANGQQWTLLEQSIDQAFSQTVDNVLITGDFNVNILTSPRNRMSNLVNSYNAEQLINTPTHFTEHSSSLIDLMIIKHKHHVLTSFVAAPFVPDLVRFHCPIVSVLKCSKPKVNTYKRKIWLYDRGDYQAYRNELNSVNWNAILDNNDTIDKIANSFCNVITTAATNTIPNKIVTIRPNDLPWINNELRRNIRKRTKLHTQAKRLNTEAAWQAFRTIRNRVTKDIRKSKAEYQAKLIDQINDQNQSPKSWFKLAKRLTQKQSTKTIPTLIQEGITATTDKQKAELLNEYFSKQSNVEESNINLPNLNKVTDHSLNQITISEQDVRDAISLIDPSKACGPDSLHPRLLKEGACILCKPLTRLFNLSLANSSFPSQWKLANVTAVFKKDDPSKPSNYRPISLLSCLGKLMERCVHKHMYNYLVSNRLITDFQSGFMQGDSTVNQLTYLYNDISKALDEGLEIRAVFCDISKAFDRVWHRGLLSKLSSLGISDSLLGWFKSYLSDRKQRVVYTNTSSKWSTINAGVPQGSILGPLLFLTYINDIVNHINSKIRLFADDTSLYIIVENPDTAAAQLNTDLQRIYEWSKIWLVTFNPSKTEAMIFSRKRHKPIHPPLFFNSEPISQVTKHTHLGLTLSDDAKWETHISIIIQKAWKRIGIMRNLKYLLNRSCLEKMYTTFVRPIVEYADIVWDNCSNMLKNEIESIQNEAARIVTGATKLCNIHKILTDLKWETLATRRKHHRLIQFYKMQNNLTPPYLSNLIPSNAATNTYNLRNVTRTISSRTEAHRLSFLPSTVRDWNCLPLQTREAPSLASFKRRLVGQRCKPSPLFNIGSRRGQILHARLRLDCSSLNFDLHRKSIIQSPLCLCGHNETVKHFLLHCPRYDVLRQRLIQNLPCPPTVNNLLYGNEHLSLLHNKDIILKVQQYIIASKRFTNSN